MPGIIRDATGVRLAPVNDPIASLVLMASPGNVEVVIVAGKLRRHS